MTQESSSKSGRHPRKRSAAGQGARRPSLLKRGEARAVTVLLAALIAVIALIPGPAGPPTLIGWDKLDHVAAFAALTLMARCGWPDAPRWSLAGGAFLYGVAIEFAQATATVGRVASVSDLVANAVGVAVGLTLAWGFGRIGAALPRLDRRRG